MKITVLVENQSKGTLKAAHGLSLYIETEKHKILFDVGSDDTLFNNAKACAIDLSCVDTVIISHGHMDHGGALSRFLQINSQAKVYVQRKAFEPHYCKVLFLKVNIGIDAHIKNHPQIVLIDGDYQIDDELHLCTVNDTGLCYSTANDILYEKGQKDDFSHEQHLVINEQHRVVFMGCGHAGVVNIMKKARMYDPQFCIGGYHLFNPLTKKMVSPVLLNDIAKALQEYSDVTFYTCHCTGTAAFEYLSKRMSQLLYVSCGEEIVL